MFIRITCDINKESGVGDVVSDISGPTRKHFHRKQYGKKAFDICVVLMCRDPSLKFKRRMRFAKKDNTLYMDVMLELKEMKRAAHVARKRLIAKRLAIEVPEALEKYAFEDFAIARFKRDWTRWLSVAGSKATDRPKAKPKPVPAEVVAWRRRVVSLMRKGMSLNAAIQRIGPANPQKVQPSTAEPKRSRSRNSRT